MHWGLENIIYSYIAYEYEIFLLLKRSIAILPQGSVQFLVCD